MNRSFLKTAGTFGINGALKSAFSFIVVTLLAGHVYAATVTYVGNHVDLGGAWRTTSVAKPLDADKDNVYGTDGWLLIGLGRASYPQYVTGTAINHPQIGGSSSYNAINDPINPTSQIFSGTTTDNGDPAFPAAIFSFKIASGVPGTVRVGIFIDNLDGAGYVPSKVRIAGINGTSGDSGTITTTTPNKVGDWYFFDVTGAVVGNEFGVIEVAGTYGFRTLSAITWDHAATQASSPVPADEETNVSPLVTLHWTPVLTAQSQKVYLGTVPGSLTLAATVAGNSTSYQPAQVPLALNTEYFWRIDTIVNSQTWSGLEWSFKTIPANADLVSDDIIDMFDLAVFAAHWLSTNCTLSNNFCDGTDLNYSGKVDSRDYALFANHWGDVFAYDLFFDFETGDLQDWRIVDGSFGMFVCDRAAFHTGGATYNKQGTYFLSSLETPSYGADDAYTGTAESPVFLLTDPQVSFLVGGGSGSTTYIALCTVDNDLNEQEVKFARGVNSEVMQRINWNVPELVGKKVFVRFYDHSISGWGHITFDDFSAKGIFQSALTARRWAKLPLPVDIDSARAAVEDMMGTYSTAQYPNGQQYLNQLDSYAQQVTSIIIGMGQGTATQGDLDALIVVVKNYIRQVLLTNPIVISRPILFNVRDQYAGDHHNTHTFFPSYDSEHNDGVFRTGAALKKIDLAAGGTVTTLIETPDGIIRDPDIYFDGSKIVFAKRDNWTDNFSIFEINTNGTNLKQLTTASRVDDLDPIYMPDDSIVFSSSREPKYVHCNRHLQCNLYKIDFDGANIHQISHNTLFDFHCSLMDDGRIMYSRWEYVDRNFGDAESIWTSRPDGTNHAVYFGNNTPSPGAIFNPRQIPGTQQMVCIFGSCHDRPWGAMAIVDRRLGVDLPQPNKPNPVQHIWPENIIDVMGGWEGNYYIPESSIDSTLGLTLKYEDPYPLYDVNHPDRTGKYFLVSRMTGNGEKMGIYLLDVFGNEILLHEESGSKGCYDPMPIGARQRPPQIPTQRTYTENTNGKFYVTNVYEGTHMQGVEPGTIKYLRVLEATEKLTWSGIPWNGQGYEMPGMAWHDFYSKKILGTVPVEDDGSAYFEVPSEAFVYFQLLDVEGKMVQSMRSGTLVQPGELNGCIGCHESRTQSYLVAKDFSYLPAAIQREPSQMNGWFGQTKNYNYLDDVQPVFTKNCVSCHGFDTLDGAKAGLILEPDKEVYFNTSYNELWRKGYTGVIGAGPAPIQQAYSWGSHASRLIAALNDINHIGVSLTPEERTRIITWIDLNAPYYPVYTSAYPNNPAGRSPLTDDQLTILASLTHYSFAQKAPPYLSFDRPEKSICLNGLSGPTYSQALAIIQAGKNNLTINPRADMRGHVPNTGDQLRLQKYDLRKIIEQTNRRAIREGWQNYDQ